MPAPLTSSASPRSCAGADAEVSRARRSDTPRPYAAGCHRLDVGELAVPFCQIHGFVADSEVSSDPVCGQVHGIGREKHTLTGERCVPGEIEGTDAEADADESAGGAPMSPDVNQG